MLPILHRVLLNDLGEWNNLGHRLYCLKVPPSSARFLSAGKETGGKQSPFPRSQRQQKLF